MDYSNKPCKYAHLNGLSTPELEEILRADMAQPDKEDTDMVLYIMEVIEQRENGKSEDRATDTARAWKEFQAIYNTPESVGRALYPTNQCVPDNKQTLTKSPKPVYPQNHRHRQVHRFLATAAALLIVVLLLVPPALGYASFYEMIGHWTDQVFHFRTSSDSENSNPGYNGDHLLENIPGEYTTLSEALAAYGISDTMIPSQMPEGFELANLDVSVFQEFGTIEISAYYEREESSLTVLIICHSGSPTSKYEKDDSLVEEYVSNGIAFYLFENLNQQVAAWYIDSCECSISGDISRDEMKAMIDTIHTEVIQK